MNAPRTPFTRVAAYALIVQNSSLVLCRLAESVKSYHGQWTLPGGGLDFGEDPADAVVREVDEETGLQVRVLGIAGIDSMCLDIANYTIHGIRIIYNVELLGGDLRFEIGGTTDQCAWHSLNETNDLPLVELARVGIDLAFPSR